MSDKAEVNRHIENLDARAMARELKKLSDKVEALEIEMRAFLPDDTTPKPDSNGWIPWGGGKHPASGGALVDVRYQSGREYFARPSSNLDWSHYTDGINIIAYRPAKQEAEWPQVGEEVWFVYSDGDVDSFIWRTFHGDNERQRLLGIYPTREAAEEAAEKIKRVMEHLRAGKSAVLLRSDAKDWVVSL